MEWYCRTPPDVYRSIPVRSRTKTINMEKKKLEIVLEEVLEELKTVKNTALEQKQQTW